MKRNNLVVPVDLSIKQRVEIWGSILLYATVITIAQSIAGIKPSLIELSEILGFCWLGTTLVYKALLLVGYNVKPLVLVSLIVLVVWYVVVASSVPDVADVSYGDIKLSEKAWELVVILSFAVWVTVDIWYLFKKNKPLK